MLNSLPTDTVNSKTVVEFKTKLDKIWQDRSYDMADIYSIYYLCKSYHNSTGTDDIEKQGIEGNNKPYRA